MLLCLTCFLLFSRKSVGTQISWGVRFSELAQVQRFLDDMAREIQKRMKEVNARGKRINLKVSALLLCLYVCLFLFVYI